MPALLEYLLKVSVSLTALCLFYYLLLRPMTHYTCNRWFLLVYSALSFVLPFINISGWLSAQPSGVVYLAHRLPSISTYAPSKPVAVSSSSWEVPSLVLLLFLTGVVVLLLRLWVQVASIRRLQAHATLLHDGAVKLYHVAADILPFSFLNRIYINNQHSAEELQEILAHEGVHVQQKHTIDVLIAEGICLLNWYNPFAWLIKRAIKENLEFIADEQVLASGVNKKQYQYHLLKVMGYTPVSLTTPFNFASLKMRMIMMNKIKTPQVHLWKLLFIAPLLGLLLLAFRTTPEDNKAMATLKENGTTGEESFRLNHLTYSIQNGEVATLVRKEQEKSLLKPGQLLSLSLLEMEGARLKNLLRQNGYGSGSDPAVTFLMDSSLTNKSFSIRVLIDVLEKGAIAEDKGSGSHTAIEGDERAQNKGLPGGNKIPLAATASHRVADRSGAIPISHTVTGNQPAPTTRFQ